MSTSEQFQKLSHALALQSSNAPSATSQVAFRFQMALLKNKYAGLDRRTLPQVADPQMHSKNISSCK